MYRQQNSKAIKALHTKLALMKKIIDNPNSSQQDVYISKRSISQLQKAIYKWSLGTYGICDVCEKPISRDRMKKYPDVTLCISCKRENEIRRVYGHQK